MTTGAYPTLRFDRVALRLVRTVTLALSEAAPEGQVLVFTVTAPIRQAGKTAQAMIQSAKAWLADGSPGALDLGLHGNQVRFRLMRRAGSNAVRVAGFVHNPAPPPDALFDLIAALLRQDPAAIPAPLGANDRTVQGQVSTQLFDAIDS